MQRIFRLLLVAAAILISGVWFVHWSRTRALNSGEVHVRQQPADNGRSAAPTTETATDTASRPTQPQEVASNTGEPSRPQPQIITALPASQPASRNSSNRLVAAGSGKFELYRQGDLTFRLNTETGDACVLLATEAQWSKSIVYDHGCNGHR